MKVDLKSFLFFIVMIISGTVYIHVTFARANEVESLTRKMDKVENLICLLAIDAKIPTARELCRK